MLRSSITDLSALHHKVCEGDTGALEHIVGNLLRHVPAAVERKFPYAAADVVCDGVVDALLDYSRRPDSFDPSQGLTLDRFIFLASARNVSNLLRSEERRRSRENRYAVETSRLVRTRSHVREPLAANLLRARIINLVSAGPERSAFLAWLDDMDTAKIAQHLNVAGLPVKEQVLEVKRFKDRIRRRILRYFMTSAAVEAVFRTDEVA
jgi:hypothetical protein